MSDEEKKAIERIDYIQDFIIENGQYNADVNDMQYFSKVLNLIEKQSKEIEELSDKLTEKICKGVEEEILEEYRQTIISKDKEIEELKEDRKKYAEEYIHNNPWLYKQLNENYILRVESEQKERKAWIKGKNDADELCNKKWEDKIKAKIEEIDREIKFEQNEKVIIWLYKQKKVLQSLLEKE